MIPLLLSRIATIVGGTLEGTDVEVVGPAFVDSRAVEPGGLFVALPGEQVDGHTYAGAAVAAGAAGVLGARPTGVPTVVVGDPLAALQTLAREVLVRRRSQRAPLTVFAITGSAGKTSTKDLLAAVLRHDDPTVATYGSYNNEIGLPLTVLRVEERTRHLVLEMGARGVGHLTDLCAIAPPDVSLVLNVGTAHVGEFGSVEAIAQAKGELVEALAADGEAVLNADDPRVSAMAGRTRARVWTFGRSVGDVGDVGGVGDVGDVGGVATGIRLGAVELDDVGRPTFDLTHGAVTERVRLAVLGEHHALNAAAAAATAVAAGRPFDRVAQALREVTGLSKWRMELLERSDGVRVINDAYNANPESVRAALETLAGIGRHGVRTIAVLGEMRELGPDSAAQHRRVGAWVRELGIDHLVVVGDGADGIIEGVGGWGSPLRAADVHEAVALVGQTVRGPDVVLVKASRGAALERVVDGLMAGPVNLGEESER